MTLVLVKYFPAHDGVQMGIESQLLFHPRHGGPDELQPVCHQRLRVGVQLDVVFVNVGEQLSYLCLRGRTKTKTKKIKTINTSEKRSFASAQLQRMYVYSVQSEYVRVKQERQSLPQ